MATATAWCRCSRGTPGESLTVAPVDGYFSDEADAGGDGDPEDAMGGWFAYDSTTHALTHKDIVCVARSLDSSYFKVQIESCYDEAGTRGLVRFRWAPIDLT